MRVIRAIRVLAAVCLFTSFRANAATVTVNIENFDFNPMNKSIQVGDTIHWVWVGGLHSTTAAAGQVESWDSTIHSTPFSFDHVFARAGVFGYYCRVHGLDAGNGRGGGMMFGTITVTAPGASQLINISTRLRVETGDNVGIGGFVISGGSKKVLVRALGPSLAGFGVTGALQDPAIRLVGSTQNTLAQNDDWKSDQQAEIQATGFAPSDDRECGIVITLPAGSYTALLSGVGNTSGVGIVEVYDLDTTQPGRLINVSTRGQVQTGDSVMIGGFVIGGGMAPKKVIVRGIGPSLTAFGVPGALQNPTIQLFSGPTAINSDDDWKTAQQTEIVASGFPPTDDRESAIVATLQPGAYTVIVSGVSATNGVGLVEVYELP